MKRPVPGHFGVLAAALLGLAGCQHTFSRPAAPDAAPTARAVSLTPAQKADMKVAGGQMLERNGNDVQAAFAYREALALNPRHGEASLRLAILCDKQGQFAESEKLYEIAMAERPRDPAVLRNKGYSLFLQHRYEDARMILRQSLLLDPTSATAHNNLGRVLAQLGAIDEALEEFAHGGCTNAEAQANVAYVLSAQGRWDLARQHYQLALAADPSSARAANGLRELDRLLARAGQWPGMNNQ